MKFNAKYQLGKGLAFLGLATLTFAGCDKDPVEPNNPNNPQKHNVELVYGRDPDTQWQNIAMDTLYKYNAGTTVDTIFMIPEYSSQWSTFNATQLRYCINRLRPRHNINPNKIFGKGDLVLNDMVTNGHPEIVRFFADTLKYNVVLPTKTR
ncbi:MAG: hypothetical protein IKQ20_01930 [Bacteroidales bacterium]|nr:hypothetical protein [Bacteroidales bacterium]